MFIKLLFGGMFDGWKRAKEKRKKKFQMNERAIIRRCDSICCRTEWRGEIKKEKRTTSWMGENGETGAVHAFALSQMVWAFITDYSWSSIECNELIECMRNIFFRFLSLLDWWWLMRNLYAKQAFAMCHLFHLNDPRLYACQCKTSASRHSNAQKIKRKNIKSKTNNLHTFRSIFFRSHSCDSILCVVADEPRQPLLQLFISQLKQRHGE